MKFNLFGFQIQFNRLSTEPVEIPQEVMTEPLWPKLAEILQEDAVVTLVPIKESIQSKPTIKAKVKTHTVVLLVGPSGCGKTTFSKHMITQLKDACSLPWREQTNIQ